MKIFFPGSFDPFTIGHENLILRTIDIFKNEKIEFDIAVAINPNKKGYFPVKERYEALKNGHDYFHSFILKYVICVNLIYVLMII